MSASRARFLPRYFHLRINLSYNRGWKGRMGKEEKKREGKDIRQGAVRKPRGGSIVYNISDIAGSATRSSLSAKCRLRPLSYPYSQSTLVRRKRRQTTSLEFTRPHLLFSARNQGQFAVQDRKKKEQEEKALRRDSSCGPQGRPHQPRLTPPIYPRYCRINTG